MPLRNATVFSISSMSPCRQLWPSIREMDAMFPAPNAATGAGSSTRATTHMSKMLVMRSILLSFKPAQGTGRTVIEWAQSNYLIPTETGSSTLVRSEACIDM